MPFVENVRVANQNEFWSVLWPLVGGYRESNTIQAAGVFSYNREKRVELHRPLVEGSYGKPRPVLQQQDKFLQKTYDVENDLVRTVKPEFNENIHVHVSNYTCNCAGPSGEIGLGRFIRNPPYTGFKGDISGPKKFGGRASMYTRFTVNLIEGERIFLGGKKSGLFGGLAGSTYCMLEARQGGRIWAIGGGQSGVQNPITYWNLGNVVGNYNPDFYDAIFARPINFPPNQDNVIEIRSCLHDGWGIHRTDDPWNRNLIPIEGENKTIQYTLNWPGEIDFTARFPLFNCCLVYVNGDPVFSYVGPAEVHYWKEPLQPSIFSNLVLPTPFYPGNPTLPSWYGAYDGWVKESKGAGSKIWGGAHYVLDYEVNGPTLDETPFVKTMADPYPESGYEICEFTKPHNERRFFIDTIGSTDIVCRPQRFTLDTPTTFKKNGAYYTKLASFELPNFKSYGSFPQIDGYIDFDFYQLAMSGAKGIVRFYIYWRSATVVDPENPYAGFNRFFPGYDFANIVWDDWGPSPGGTRTGKLYFPEAMPAGSVGEGLFQLYFGTQKSVNVTLSR